MKSIPPLFAFLLFTLPLFAADPAGQVEENRRIEQEIRNLEARWTEQANANKQRERENRNLERVIAQQQAVVKLTGFQPNEPPPIVAAGPSTLPFPPVTISPNLPPRWPAEGFEMFSALTRTVNLTFSPAIPSDLSQRRTHGLVLPSPAGQSIASAGSPSSCCRIEANFAQESATRNELSNFCR